MAIMQGALVTQGPGLAMPSLPMGEVAAVTPDTLRMQQLDDLQLQVGRC